MRKPAIATAFLLATACAYILPASWRAFRADPDDAAPAITRALDAKNLVVQNWDQQGHRIVTGWEMVNSGVTITRQRYVVTWEREEKEGTLTVYVRHEAQEKEIDTGEPSWGSTFHESKREESLLDLISKELVAMNEAPPRSKATTN